MYQICLIIFWGKSYIVKLLYYSQLIACLQSNVKMPKATEKSHKTTYPPGCKELHEGLSTDELLKRLKV